MTARDAAAAPVAPDDGRAVELAVRVLAVRHRLGAEWRDSTRVVVRPAGNGWAP